ncbi:glycosyltransferase family 2 protein [uncultured Parasphingorhabdus sp.]|uniref:glycosyltransferase family 2 protein n=1 Tax=uncultured Parasphingorhabdus sp. TaxID=2709694 RepID=UPI0037493191
MLVNNHRTFRETARTTQSMKRRQGVDAVAIFLDLNSILDEAQSGMIKSDSHSDQSEKTSSVPMINTEYVSGLVSVIIPTFNRKQLVQDALASVVAQTWPDIEIIVVDDGSTDGTFERLTRWQRDNPEIAFTVLHQDNAGVASARNNGLAHARGEFLYMLDSDDLVFPDALETLVQLLSAGNFPYAIANIHSSDENGRILAADKSGISRSSEQNILSNSWMTHAALYRRSTLLESGIYNNSLVVGEDTEFVWRVVAKTGSGSSTSKYIGLRRQHSFGHLSFNRTDHECTKSSLQARLAFREWANSENLEIEKTDMRYRIAIVGMAIRFGCAGDWESKDHAKRLYVCIMNHPDRKPNFVDILAMPNRRLYYHFLLSIYLAAKGIRGVYRFVRNLRDSGHQGAKAIS